MKLYLIVAKVDDHENQIWAGSQADAAKARKELANLGATRKDTSTYEVDVPTGKAELLQFLNDYQGSASFLAGMRELTAS